MFIEDRSTAREQFTWMPDNARLLMEGRFENEQRIWIVPLDGTAPTQLKSDVKEAAEARVSLTGRRSS